MTASPTAGGFDRLHLAPALLRALHQIGFNEPTPIQAAAIPAALDGRDVVGIAQTGTGKTLAFGLPIAQRLTPGRQALVLAPTRELAQQIQESLLRIGLRSALVVGGAGMGPQVSALRRKPQVIVATPGRLLDHLAQRTVSLRDVSVCVLDEADRMLDIGFGPAIRRILEACPTERQTMLFSATMPKEIAEMARTFTREPKTIEVAPPNSTVDRIEQELAVIPHEHKRDLLGCLLREQDGAVLVFSRTRHGARKLAKTVRALGHTAAELHSDRTLAQRREALSSFKSGGVRVLVATDIAARGIDVKDIALVINYDVPENPEDYVHRIGRTGRAGASGKAILMATPEQTRDVLDIEKLIQSEIPMSRHTQFPLERAAKPARATHGVQLEARRPQGPAAVHGAGKRRRRRFEPVRPGR